MEQLSKCTDPKKLDFLGSSQKIAALFFVYAEMKVSDEYGEKNKLDILRFLHQGIKVKSGEMFDVVKIVWFMP